jgi:ribose 5-phosphate isomerase B
MKIAVGSDHAGYELKVRLLDQIKALGHEIVDFGSYNPDPVDFPDIAKPLTESILSGECERGIMFCGTGVGAAIACNKVKGIRASVCHDIYSAHQCVEHDNVQVMCLGNQIIGHTVALELINSFLNAKFSTDEDFRRRVDKLSQMES